MAGSGRCGSASAEARAPLATVARGDLFSLANAIAAATGGLREAVIDGETGVLIESDDPADWAAEIERLLGDPELASRMGAAARAHALQHSWVASTRKLLAVYRELLATKP